MALSALGACSAEPHPNVLLITVDTLRADHLGTYGYDRPTSPRIDAFADTAAVFESAHASSSWTLPGLATIMTGFFSSTHGCWGYSSRLDGSFRTLAEVMRDNGYDTGAVASHVYLDPQYGLDQGFVHYDDELVHKTEESHQAISSPQVSDKGIFWLEQKGARRDDVPWLLWLHYFDPHDVYQAHAGFSDAFGTESEVDLYDGEIAFTDFHIGRVLDALERTGLAGDTIVVFASDHGEEFGDHGGTRHGHALYRELVRVPLIVRVPGFAPRRIEEMVRTVDVAPTLLDAVGLPDALSLGGGRSLLPLLAGGDDPERPALSELRRDAGLAADSLVADGYKLILDFTRGNAEMLFDLEADPLEQNDLADEQPERVAAMKETLALLKAEARELSELFDTPDRLELLPSEIEALQALGYVDEK